MLVFYTMALALVEAISQFLLKTGRHAFGVMLYTIVPILLGAAYRSGLALSTVQVAWSSFSIALAVIQGWILFKESPVRLLPPIGLLVAAIVTTPWR